MRQREKEQFTYDAVKREIRRIEWELADALVRNNDYRRTVRYVRHADRFRRYGYTDVLQ